MILFIIAILALLVGAICLFIEDSRVFGGVATVLAVVLLVIGCLTIVPTGHTGVVTNFGKVGEQTLDSGVHFKAPWTKIVKMDNRTQKESLEMACFSSDIQEVNITYTVNYRIQSANAQTIYKTIGKKYYDTVITPCIQESLKTVVARYTAEELVGSRANLAKEVDEMLSNKLKNYNIELINTSVENIDFTDSFTNAVEEKQVAQQNKLKAETQAEQKIIEAEAEAKAKLIKAEADAKANEILTNSLTEDILYQKWLETWDGKLPQVAGSDAKVIIDGLTDGKTK